MTDIVIKFGAHLYTIEYEEVEKEGVCEMCGCNKMDVEGLDIEYIVRQQGCSPGKDINPESELGKRIIEIVKYETIYEGWCLDCLAEHRSYGSGDDDDYD